MRKTIIMGLGGLGLALSFAGVAAAQQAGQDAPRRDKVERERGENGPAKGRNGAPDGFLLRGITLTDAQKTQLQTLRKAEHDKVKSSREQGQTQFDEVRAARERGDTAAARAIMLRNQAMEQGRAQHLAAARNILTAEQRVQFDKNVAELKLRQERRGDGAVRRGNRGPRSR